MKYCINVEKIKITRLNMGLSQTDLAQRSGVSYLAINRLENQKTTSPHPRTIKKICDVLNLQVADVCAFRGGGET